MVSGKGHRKKFRRLSYSLPPLPKTTKPQYIEIEHPGLYRHGSSLSPWQIISKPNEIGQVWIQAISGVQEVAQLDELAPWRELVPA